MTPTPGSMVVTLELLRAGYIPAAQRTHWAAIIDAANEDLLTAARSVLYVLDHDTAPETVDAAVAALRKALG